MEYGTEGLERESPPCRSRCCVFSRCCCCRRGSESDSTEYTSTSSYDSRGWDGGMYGERERYGERNKSRIKRSMARNHYEMDDHYEEISYSDRDQDLRETRLGDDSYDSSSSS